MAVLGPDDFQPGQSLYLDRLYTRTDRIVATARFDLENIFATYGLSKDQLLAAQRTISDQAKKNTEPNLTQFWESTAKPTSERLQNVASTRINQCRADLASALEQLALTLEHWPLVDQSHTTPYAAELYHRDLFRKSLHGALQQVLNRFRSVVPDSKIDDLGLWWQTRLHRSALATTFGKSMLVATSQFMANARDYEMQLLNTPPWSHGDRLLFAFEVADREIGKALISAEQDLALTVLTLAVAD